jgi:hypothetical protein
VSVGEQAAALYLRCHSLPYMSHLEAWRVTAVQSAAHPGDPAWAWPSDRTVDRWWQREHPLHRAACKHRRSRKGSKDRR